MELGWIDFSDNDRKKVMDVIHLLSEKGAVDELGFGIIRDGFADYFFPGTSTIQTRAKYFFIVPYILKDAVTQNKMLPNIYLEKNEKAIAQDLFDKGMKNGLIGSVTLASRKWVVRTPSEIYWNGIKKLGIFKENISIAQYFAEYAKLQKLKSNTGGNKKDKEEGNHDDSDAGKGSYYNFWNMPVYTKNWTKNLSIDLEQKEAEFLTKRIMSLKTVKNNESLYSYLVRNKIELNQYNDLENPFEALTNDLSNSVNDEVSDMMKLANQFNYLAMIAKVRYNKLISNDKNDKANKLWEKYKEDLKKIADVDVDKIFLQLNIRPNSLKAFLKQLQIELTKGDIDKVDELVKNREKRLKGSERAKLLHPDKYVPESYQDSFVGGVFLDYRMNSAKVIINDIYEAENV